MTRLSQAGCPNCPRLTGNSFKWLRIVAAVWDTGFMPRCPRPTANLDFDHYEERPFENPFNGGVGRGSRLWCFPLRRAVGGAKMRKREWRTCGKGKRPELCGRRIM